MEGYEKGETCNRAGCLGVIEQHEKEGCCSCHINPPCGYCTTASEYCPACGWDAIEEQQAFEKLASEHFKRDIEHYAEEARKREEAEKSFYRKWRGEEPATKLEIRYESHTHFTMIKKGVFPKGTETAATLIEQIRGTFGGRFVLLDDYRFEYIAYTD